MNLSEKSFFCAATERSAATATNQALGTSKKSRVIGKKVGQPLGLA